MNLPRSTLFDFVSSVSDAVDLISPTLNNHHKIVTYLALRIAGELDMPVEQQRDLRLAGLLHDVGAVSLAMRKEALQFDFESHANNHGEVGYLLLRDLPYARGVAPIVRFHHIPWDQGAGARCQDEDVPIGSHVLHLADRVSVLIDREQEVLRQVPGIVRNIRQQSGRMFVPQLVEAFTRVASCEDVWLHAVDPAVTTRLRELVPQRPVQLLRHDVLSLANLFSQIIDFRSSFTATHSAGVAAVAESVGRLVGFCEDECWQLKVAGYLHDLGKLAIPAEILDKPGRLTDDEYASVRTHTFYTYTALESLKDLETVNHWASFHHERLDGKGYPFHLTGERIPLGSRIMAIADIFCALTEDRPYRAGMTASEVRIILRRMADSFAIDGTLVSLVDRYFDALNTAREAAASTKRGEYRHCLVDGSCVPGERVPRFDQSLPPGSSVQ